jgi:hypothetical protein
MGDLSCGYKRCGVKITTHLHLVPHSHISLRGMHSNNSALSVAHILDLLTKDAVTSHYTIHQPTLNVTCAGHASLSWNRQHQPAQCTSVPGAAGHSSPEHVYSDVQHIYSLTVSGAGIPQSHEELCYGLSSSCNVDGILAVKKKYFLFPKVPIPARSHPRLQPMGAGCCFLHRREGDRPLTSI